MNYVAAFLAGVASASGIAALVLSRLERRERAQSEGRERPPCYPGCTICAPAGMRSTPCE